ncbi:MAG: DUF370 domain-containing protein [Clostridia bacterium]|nr:DUF370 domain-containing protein [Clostridia bacterium]
MYLHAGGNIVIRKKDIVGIFDIDNMNTEETMKDFLRRAEKKGETSLAGEGLPKSFILVKRGEEEKVIFSPISSQRLIKRAEI